ncbi:hypothetical protein [Acidithiobacillus thiooxidans]|uniref:hypothetical protein n=1 Tax=Acidithiobacillus thiooxidans TaxID=930 RepID=UPI001C068D1F|nr:hypothetical protein [Acidithiobacillus thiooxidans]MBU2843911.1 hypothetical protein [Acidithiobacillus thiooxidans]
MKILTFLLVAVPIWAAGDPAFHMNDQSTNDQLGHKLLMNYLDGPSLPPAVQKAKKVPEARPAPQPTRFSCSGYVEVLQGAAIDRDNGLPPQAAYRQQKGTIAMSTLGPHVVKQVINSLYFGKLKQEVPAGVAEQRGFGMASISDCQQDRYKHEHPTHWKPLS